MRIHDGETTEQVFRRLCSEVSDQELRFREEQLTGPKGTEHLGPVLDREQRVAYTVIEQVYQHLGNLSDEHEIGKFQEVLEFARKDFLARIKSQIPEHIAENPIRISVRAGWQLVYRDPPQGI